MTRPHKLLIDLAAGCTIEQEIGLDVVHSAEEHRMTGLLKSAVDAGSPIEDHALAELNRADALGWARNQMLLDATGEIAAIAQGLGIDIFFIKGAANELRWYSRLGERPAWDVNVVLAPWDRHRIRELLIALQPRHSLLAEPAALQSVRLQNIDLGFHSLPVDLHLDPLKLEVAAARQPEALFQGSTSLLTDSRKAFKVLGVEACLVLAALHLNKDRFRFLLGYVDVTRIANDPSLGLDRAMKLAETVGLVRSFRSTLAAAHADLGLASPDGLSTDDHLWNSAWPPSIRLLGTEGEARFRYRQFLLPLLEGHKWREVLAAWWHRFLPPDYEVRRNFPREKGSYLARLIKGRFRVRVARSRRRRQERFHS